MPAREHHWGRVDREQTHAEIAELARRHFPLGNDHDVDRLIGELTSTMDGYLASCGATGHSRPMATPMNEAQIQILTDLQTKIADLYCLLEKANTSDDGRHKNLNKALQAIDLFDLTIHTLPRLLKKRGKPLRDENGTIYAYVSGPEKALPGIVSELSKLLARTWRAAETARLQLKPPEDRGKWLVERLWLIWSSRMPSPNGVPWPQSYFEMDRSPPGFLPLLTDINERLPAESRLSASPTGLKELMRSWRRFDSALSSKKNKRRR